MENYQVRYYDQTIVQANLEEEMEALLNFMEELIKRKKGEKKFEDIQAF